MTNMVITSSFKYLIPVVLTVFISWFPVSVFSDSVVSFDSVTTVHTPVYLKVQTRGKIFPKGGERVTVQENGLFLKKLLTGGDGFGYFNYSPKTKGLKTMTYFFGQEVSESMVLVLEEDDPVVIIELETVLAKERLFDEINKEAVDVIKALSREFHIVYVCGAMEKVIGNRKWLTDKNMPQSAVLSYAGTSSFQFLMDRKVNIHAVIGSSLLLTDASNFSENRFSFEKTTHGQQVQNWYEILKVLEK